MNPTISHLYQTSSGEWVIQSNEAHTQGVADLAARFAGKFGLSSWGRALGLFHDKGKESCAFQQHIRRESGYDPTLKVVGDYHHAFVGGILARECYGPTAVGLLSNAIVSHHTGLHDSDEMGDILSKAMPKEVNGQMDKPNLERLPFAGFQPEELHHLVRMLFSCLVDADYLDTEAFMNPSAAALRGSRNTLSDLLPLLEEHLKCLGKSAKPTEANLVRQEVQGHCADAADSPVGFYSLTVPTGGGKTLASLLWAMKHAVRNGLKRVIIAIPYTSIIVQTAAVLRSIFGDENVLEHHSGADLEGKENEKKNQEKEEDEAQTDRVKLATENWDYPIIVTTNVRLFESIFANRPSTCRKLHNIEKSVIILDEVHTLPAKFLQPIVDSLKAYQHLFGVSVLFTTASQPVLQGRLESSTPKVSFDGIEHITEIIPHELQLHERLRRVRLQIDSEGHSYDEVANMLCRHKRVLCIVNTRKDARELFSRLPQEGITLHLSRMMCPEHIRQTIERIKAALKVPENEIIRVVSTQLVEAGVDMDFPVVYRQEAGLDSLLQAAGRCNREGLLEMCTTHVFSLSKEHALPKGDMAMADASRKNMGNNHDWFAPETMAQYFKQFYTRQPTFDVKDMKHYLYSPNEMYFKSAAKEFHLIENDGPTVFVPWGKGASLIQRLLREGPSYQLMKKLSRFGVSVRNYEFNELKQAGVVDEMLKGVYVVNVPQQYDEHLGLLLENLWEDQILIS